MEKGKRRTCFSVLPMFYLCCICEFQTMQPDLLVVVADKHGCIIFVCNK